MKHDDIRHKLSDYLDGSISAREKTEIENHLKTCRECSDALQELRKTIEHIKTVDEIDPPAWMTQKIMAAVRAEAEGKESIFRRFFHPLMFKHPIQAIAVLFIAVTGFYIYQAIGPASRPSEAPARGSSARNEASPSVAAQDKTAKAYGPAVRPRQVPQTPAYKSLDMKLEYEKPSAPVPASRSAEPAPVPGKYAEQPMLAEQEASSGRTEAAPQAGPTAMMKEQNVGAKDSRERTTALSESKEIATAEGTSATPPNRFEEVVLERYPDDKPELVVTYELVGLHRVKRAEERYNSRGERHGLQRDFYESGRVKTEAQYGAGKLEWYREFQPDGVKKLGKSDFDWFWLKK
jgi:Putative zinc-finger/Predicted integral membrane protein (DUF2275)